MTISPAASHDELAGHLARCADTGAPCRLSADQLAALLARLFERAGASAATAAVLAQTCALAEQDEARSHGLHRVAGYVATLGTDWVDGHAEPAVIDASGATIIVDARNGFAQCALRAARPLIEERVRQHGLAVLLTRNSHHFGALWLDVEPYARQQWIALTAVNSISHMAPHGGTTPLYGTNPMAFACPRAGADPLVFDQASSVMAKGDVQLAAQHGHTLPPDAGVDRHGQPTRDPAAVLDGGALLPFGGHKGSAIAMMVEVLAAALTGGSFSWEVDRSAHPTAQTSRTGQFFLCIDPARSAGHGFAARIDQLAQALLRSGQQRLPGERRYAARRLAAQHGIAIDPAALLALLRLA
ncbi:Ldh family oxidoreductase [Bordetella parapertussis]|uniref:Malate/L-lactate dehydrogenase n=2 Tax=Bordetella parapertussis TaxID=519 RepID=Q7WAR0_BORPA|nr:Ldh family oxidoreductase [Bordetella parapertussis]AOB38538.1 lactate dehydrogenase [Bordetella parapertussis]AUL42527.1 lactate dehydrogenase [Bordetella parapertussis]AWP63953.1 lactate dehydrogenase [Bordetella parapertussis]AWP71456.1 lactate dehydrogenase [Bordetella parapertussis]AWP88529.1 lactate dehydrogenase [Bordetella parapertussis]